MTYLALFPPVFCSRLRCIAIAAESSGVAIVPEWGGGGSGTSKFSTSEIEKVDKQMKVVTEFLAHSHMPHHHHSKNSQRLITARKGPRRGHGPRGYAKFVAVVALTNIFAAFLWRSLVAIGRKS